jgi:carbon-monoxide dehydrogenase medium subunit
MDIAVVGAGISLVLDGADGAITKATLWLGAVAPTIVEVDASCLIGTKLDDAALAKLDAAAQAVCNPIDDKRGTIEYRTKVAGVLARRSAAIAFQRAGER